MGLTNHDRKTTRVSTICPNLIDEQYVQTHEDGSLRIAFGEVEFGLHVGVQVEESMNRRHHGISSEACPALRTSFPLTGDRELAQAVCRRTGSLG